MEKGATHAQGTLPNVIDQILLYFFSVLENMCCEFYPHSLANELLNMLHLLSLEKLSRLKMASVIWKKFQLLHHYDRQLGSVSPFISKSCTLLSSCRGQMVADPIYFFAPILLALPLPPHLTTWSVWRCSPHSHLQEGLGKRPIRWRPHPFDEAFKL